MDATATPTDEEIDAELLRHCQAIDALDLGPVDLPAMLRRGAVDALRRALVMMAEARELAMVAGNPETHERES